VVSVAAIAVAALVLSAPSSLVSRSILRSDESSGMAVPQYLAQRKRAQDRVTNPADSTAVRIVVAGDSTGTVVANALQRYATSHPGSIEVVDESLPGCTTSVVKEIRHFRGEHPQNMELCGLWPLRLSKEVPQLRPDLAVVFLSVMEQADQRVDGSPTWRNVLDASWRTKQEHDFDALLDLLPSKETPIFWADVPYARFQKNLPWVSDDPRRTDALNRLYRDMSASRRDMVLLDYASRLNRPGKSVDTRVRPDGIHMTDPAADQIVTEWLLPELLRAQGSKSH
jgi:hypothetical protein